MNRIKILLTDAFLSPGGGQEKVVLQLLNLLDRNKFEIFFAIGKTSEIPSGIPKDIQIFRAGFRSKFDLTSCFKIRRFVRQKNIQIINVHGFRASLLVRLAYLFSKKRVRIVYTSHVNYDQLKLYSKSRLNRFSNLIGNFLDAAVTDMLVFVSHKNLSNRLVQKPKMKESKCRVIYNGIDVSKFSFNIAAPPKKSKVIVTLSALVTRKGIPVLVEAVKILSNRGVNHFVVKIGGEGEEKEKIKKLIQQYELEKSVFLVGYVNKETLLSSADIFVLPTFSEGLPLSIVEAGLFRLPVIASGVDGIPEVIQNNKNGLLVNPGQPTELADAIHLLLKDDSLSCSLGHNLHHTVHAMFSEERMVDEYCRLFEQQLGV